MALLKQMSQGLAATEQLRRMHIRNCAECSSPFGHLCEQGRAWLRVMPIGEPGSVNELFRLMPEGKCAHDDQAH